MTQRNKADKTQSLPKMNLSIHFLLNYRATFTSVRAKITLAHWDEPEIVETSLSHP